MCTFFYAQVEHGYYFEVNSWVFKYHAQSLLHLTHNQGVAGSSPAGPTLRQSFDCLS